MTVGIDFGEILAKAWQITWKFKVLWIFGIMAGCGQGRGGDFTNSLRNSGGGGGGSGGTGNLPAWLREFENLRPDEAWRAFLGQYLGLVLAALLFLCALWAFFYCLGVMGKTGLVKGASKADSGAETLTFGELWEESRPYFWRMFGLDLLVGLPSFLLVVILLVGLFFAATAASGALLSATPGGTSGPAFASATGLLGLLGIFITGLCCLAIVFLFVGMVVEQAQNALIMEDLGILAGLSRGWEVFQRNVLTIVVLAILLAVLGGIIGFVMGLPLILLMLPVIAGVAIAGTSNYLAPLLIGGACCTFYLPVFLLVTGLVQTYTQTAWTLTYRRMTAPAPTPPPAPSFPLLTTDAQ